jgi:hypothetical protein
MFAGSHRPFVTTRRVLSLFREHLLEQAALDDLIAGHAEVVPVERVAWNTATEYPAAAATRGESAVARIAASASRGRRAACATAGTLYVIATSAADNEPRRETFPRWHAVVASSRLNRCGTGPIEPGGDRWGR